MKQPLIKIGWILLGVIALFMATEHIHALNTYFSSVRNRVMSTSGSAQSATNAFQYQPANLNGYEKSLLATIEENAKQKYIPPVNARIDSIWKAVPGYNGLQIDVEKTFMLARKMKPGSSIPYVYKQVKPRVTLGQLPPQPIYRGNADKRMAALMINVAWGNEYIPRMLKVLAQENVHATFFFDGSWLSKNEKMAKQIQAAGHELANHAYSHKNMSEISDAMQRREMEKTQLLLKEKLGVNNTLFAPPSGDYNQKTVQIAHQLGMKTVMWTLDTVDWKNPSPDWILRKMNKGMQPGSLILMHPTASSSESLDKLIRLIKDKGYTLGTVSDVLSSRRLEPVESRLNF